MKHYQKTDGSIWAFEDDGSQDALITPDMLPVAAPTQQPNPIPQTVTRFQARAALSRAGLFVTVNDMMLALPVDNEQRLAWTDALSFERTSPTLESLSVAIGLTSQDLDALFAAAAQIEA